MTKNKNVQGALVMVAVVATLVAGVLMFERPALERVGFAEFMEALSLGEVFEVTIADANLMFRLAPDGAEYVTNNPRRDTFKEELLLSGVIVYESAPVTEWQLVVVLMAAVALFVVILRRKQTAMTSAMALNPAEAGKKYSFADMAGNEEAKESVSDIVDFLARPEKYAGYGARMPRGLVLYGLPGTGKTLMAKAMAGEAGVPFYAVSGSDFVQMYVGVGAARVRELFKKARSAGKAVIFIDEIDALGKKRSASPAGGNDERDQTLNALLTEMSGFTDNESIIVVAATNRLDILDEALLRPGRFDRHVEVAMPDMNARLQILSLHANGKPHSVDLEKWARDTVFFSGAMLEGLVNEAAILAAKDDQGNITDKHFEKAYYISLAGHEKKDRSKQRQEERRVTAYHEAGHALAAKLVSPENTVAKVTIIPSAKGAGGFCVNIPPEKMYYTKRELEQQVIVHIAGRCAEEIIFGPENITTGASNDIEKATRVLKRLAAQYGMCKEIGMLDMRSLGRNTSVAQACRQMIERLYKDTLHLLRDNRDKLEAIAGALLEKESLSEDDLDNLLA